MSLEDLETSTSIDNTSKSILENINIGSFVELLVDDKSSQKTKEMSDRYAGYIVLISSKIIGVSATHPKNVGHGYICSDADYNPQKSIEIETDLIKQYRLLSLS